LLYAGLLFLPAALFAVLLPELPHGDVKAQKRA
jgi:hypothetical protein